MKKKLEKYKSIMAVGLYLLLAILAAGIAFEVAGHIKATKNLPERIKSGCEGYEKYEKDSQAYLTASAAKIEQLKKKPLCFIPQPGKPSMPQATQLLGNEVKLGNKWCKVGDTQGGARVLRIDATSVTIEWEGKEHTLYPFGKVEKSSASAAGRSSRRHRSGKPEGRRSRSEQAPEPVEEAVEDAAAQTGTVDELYAALGDIYMSDTVKRRLEKVWSVAPDRFKQRMLSELNKPDMDKAEVEEGIRRFDSMTEGEFEAMLEQMTRHM